MRSILSGNDGTVVIVGAGLAGSRAAEGLREGGFSGSIVLLNAEAQPPYDRPPLSKNVLLKPGSEQGIELLPAERGDELDLDIRNATKATRIDREKRKVTLSTGETISYDRLILATGSSVRTLPGIEPSLAGIHYLRTLDDALSLRERLTSDASHVVIIGGGIIGLEVAAACANLGRKATVIEVAERIMSRAASQPVTDYIMRRHSEAGVQFKLGCGVAAIQPRTPGGLSIGLSTGEDVDADIAVVGVGVKPNCELAEECGLQVDAGGIVVDGWGRTSDENIYAAGEVAKHFNTRLQRHDRQETWAHAASHGYHVGKSLVSADEPPYADIGSYWTDQYDFSLTAVGEPIGEENIVRGDPAQDSFLVFHLSGGKVVGVSAVNAARELRSARKLIDSGQVFEPEVLVDPATDLKTLASAAVT